ncbi:alpha/beta fold hydrolase [Kitasatospora sp. NPDC051853]|uniref:alpha/beta fold hydrolase n=1 Tax=Kitasatospora sp. NPDC051853 TaxID=3364058 RepID=UPI0037A2F3DA
MPTFSSYDGTTLHYELLGGGPPLLVLPGGPGTDLRYLGGLGGLTDRRRLVLLDPRATGRSAVPADRGTVAFTEQARDVEALRVHLGLERVDLLGHSAGCLIAQEYAAARPERVRRLVLVTPVGRAAREPDERELERLRDARAGEAWYPDAAEAYRLIAEGGHTGTEAAELGRRTHPFSWHHWDDSRQAEHRPEHGSPHAWLRAAYYAGAATPADERQRLARLAAVRVPVLVVAGASDGLIGTAPARLAAALYPDARLELMDRSGHRPWVEEPERFTELVSDFLAQGLPQQT